jgi:two-component system, response regulator
MKASSRTILLAEDNEDDAFLTTRALESAGITHPIVRCHNGQVVIDYLRQVMADGEKLGECELPALLLLDLKMTRLGGLETLRWIRDHEVLDPLIVLALTSSSEERDVAAAYHLHINAYLVKPSSLAEMIELARAIAHFWLDQNHLIRPRLSFPSPFAVARS